MENFSDVEKHFVSQKNFRSSSSKKHFVSQAKNIYGTGAVDRKKRRGEKIDSQASLNV